MISRHKHSTAVGQHVCLSEIDMDSMIARPAKNSLCDETWSELSKSPLMDDQKNPGRRFVLLLDKTIFTASDRKFQTIRNVYIFTSNQNDKS